MNESADIFDVTLDTFQDQVLEASQQVPVVLDVWAEWCAPCKQLMPILEKLAGEYKGAFKLARLNADEQQQLTAHLGVRSLPSVKIVKNGQLVDEFNGALPEKQVRELLDRHVERPQETPAEKGRRLWSEGDLEQALTLLTQANQQDPNDISVLIDIAQIRAQTGDLAGAREILDSLPPEERTHSHARQLAARLRFLEQAGHLPDQDELADRLEKDPDDLEALYLMALHQVLKGENGEAMALLLQVLQQDQGFRDGAARTTLVELFEMLGNNDPDVRAYRRRLFALLH